MTIGNSEDCCAGDQSSLFGIVAGECHKFTALCATKLLLPKYNATFQTIALSSSKINFMIKINSYIIVISLLLSAQFSFGQKTEINFNAYSGLFSFRGDGATSKSWIISYPFINTPTKYIINSYGKKTEFSFVLELQGQRLTKTKNIYGLGLSFEKLTSSVNIYKVGISGDPAYLEYPANGKTKLKNAYIALNPFIGHRYFYHKLTFDLLTGVDVAFCLKSTEAGNATINNKDYFTVENAKAKPSIDFRPRIQLKTQISKFGFLAGYSLGLTNYQNPNSPKAYSSYLRLGLSYQLK